MRECLTCQGVGLNSCHLAGEVKQLIDELAGLQGKTSRWGVAWSFSVDPGLSNKPLLQQ